MRDIKWLLYITVMFVVIIFFYKTFKYLYTKHKYKVCPKCGSKTMTNKVEEYVYADVETWEEITCTDLDCDFKHRHKWFD